eukprot:361879-Amphidinium_carterae.1
MARRAALAPGCIPELLQQQGVAEGLAVEEQTKLLLAGLAVAAAVCTAGHRPGPAPVCNPVPWQQPSAAEDLPTTSDA